MSEIKFKTGEFSRLSKVTVRALRHYEKLDFWFPKSWTDGQGIATTQWGSSRKSRTSAP